MQVTGVPSFPFYMPGSAPVEYEHENALRQRALHLAARGYDVGIDVDGGDPYIGKTLQMADMFYQTPKVPGYHFQQRMVEGDMRPPVMLPGGLSDRIALELALTDLYGDSSIAIWDDPPHDAAPLTPQQKAYQKILSEAEARAWKRDPIRRPRQA